MNPEDEKRDHDREARGAAPQPPPKNDEVNVLEGKLERIENERNEYLNGWKRAKADLINYQREEASRLEQAVKYGNEQLLKELITILDSFDLALSLERGKEEMPEVKGMVMIRSQLEAFLRNHGMEPIRAEGGRFDPVCHEAIEEVPSEKPAGTVVEEVSRGWKLYTKVVRPARVKIAKQLTSQ